MCVYVCVISYVCYCLPNHSRFLLTLEPSLNNRSGRQKISKDTMDLNNNIIHLAFTDIYKILHLTAGYPFFSNSHKTVTKIDHMWAINHTLTL